MKNQEQQSPETHIMSNTGCSCEKADHSRVKVKCSRELEMRVMPSMCDENSRMSIPAILEMFQDLAGIHADSVGIGAIELEEKGLFWIVSKIRLRIYRRPLVQEMLDAVTWIQPADRVTCERDWSISQNGDMLAYVRSVWATLRRDNGRPAHMAGFYPDSDFTIAPPDDEPFTRMSRKFEGAELLGEYKIRSVDIDRGGHMNNVNYVRAMLGCFSCAELAEMDIRELDMQFLQQCYEGETIRFVKRAAQGLLADNADNDDNGATYGAADGTSKADPDDTAKGDPDGIVKKILFEVGAINEEGAVCFVAAIR